VVYCEVRSITSQKDTEENHEKIQPAKTVVCLRFENQALVRNVLCILHKRPLANNTGGGGLKSTTNIGNFNLQKSQFKKDGETGLIFSCLTWINRF
jgi:hypothetical protein